MTTIGELYGMTAEKIREVLERQQIRDYAKEMQIAADAAAEMRKTTFTQTQ